VATSGGSAGEVKTSEHSLKADDAISLCAGSHRREIPKTVKNFPFIGVAPLLGAIMLGYLFIKALVDYSEPANSYTGQEWFGVAPPAVIGVGFLLIGVVLLFAWRRHRREPFFLRRREVATPGILDRGPDNAKIPVAEAEG
jgi:hypothetical protein